MTTMQHAQDSLETAPAAWRRPGVVFVVYAYRLIASLLVATPLALVFGSSVGGYPRADAVLFDDGGMLFVETIRRVGPLLSPLFTSTAVLWAVAAFASIVPLAALIGALSVKGKVTARDVGSFALRPVGPFALLFGAFALLQAIVFGLLTALSGAIARRPSFDAPTTDRIKIIGVLVALLFVALLGVWHDLARVAVVRDELTFRASIRRAFRTLCAAHVRVIGAWAMRALLGALVVYAALSFGSRLGVESSAKVFVGFLVYQASIVLALFLKASWFASAIRHVDHTQPTPTAQPDASPVVEALPPVEAALPPEESPSGEESGAPVLSDPETSASPADGDSGQFEPPFEENPPSPDKLDAHA